MWKLIISSLYLILPAYLGNMAPIIAGKLKLPFGTPISTKHFGIHKTYRGFYSGYFGALGCLLGQLFLQKNGYFNEYVILDYQNINLFLYAFVFGIGALTGDLIKSYFKRKIGKKEGDCWFPADQIDLILGASLFLAPFGVMTWENFITIIILTPLLHFLTNVSAYFLGIKKVWW